MLPPNVYIDSTAEHQRCLGCDQIIFYLTNGTVMLTPDTLVSKIEAKRLPPNFNKDTLPDGACPDCL